MPAGSAIEPGAADLPAPVPATSDDTAAFNAAVEATLRAIPAARRFFCRSGAGGDPDAQFNLALIYHSGEGVPRNDREALYWAWRARIEGLPAAEPLIRMLTEQGAPGLGPSIAPRLLTDLQDALKAGHGHAMLGAALVMAQLSDPPDPEGPIFGNPLPPPWVSRAPPRPGTKRWRPCHPKAGPIWKTAP
ncbi:hypothetical protein ACFSHQ_13390 [Gemmobacter lanyuensis]